MSKNVLEDISEISKKWREKENLSKKEENFLSNLYMKKNWKEGIENVLNGLDKVKKRKFLRIVFNERISSNKCSAKAYLTQAREFSEYFKENQIPFCSEGEKEDKTWKAILNVFYSRFLDCNTFTLELDPQEVSELTGLENNEIIQRANNANEELGKKMIYLKNVPRTKSARKKILSVFNFL